MNEKPKSNLGLPRVTIRGRINLLTKVSEMTQKRVSCTSSNGPPRNYRGALEVNLKTCAKRTKLRVYTNNLVNLFSLGGFNRCIRYFPSRLVHHPWRYNLTMSFVGFINVTLVTNYLSLAFRLSCVYTRSPSNKNNIELLFICYVLVYTDANKSTIFAWVFLLYLPKTLIIYLIEEMKYKIYAFKHT